MRNKWYKVIASRPHAVEFPNGDAKCFPPGAVFQASNRNMCVQRLLRIKAIRELSNREVPHSLMMAQPASPASPAEQEDTFVVLDDADMSNEG